MLIELFIHSKCAYGTNTYS